jgi:hypothetical protein
MAPRILLRNGEMSLGYLFVRLVLTAALVGGCAGQGTSPSGPYRGRVIDADTGQPLVGAAVVAAWFLDHPLAVHGAARASRVVEVLTDAQGEFAIPRWTQITLIGSMEEPRFTIYALGYGPFLGFQRAPKGEALAFAFEKYTVVELVRGKTREKRREYLGWALPFGVTEEQVPNVYRLINIESKDLGEQPIGTGGKR